MKDYVNFEGLSHFFNKLIGKFSVIGHTHTKAEINDLGDLIATDDDNGNVVLSCSSADTLVMCDNSRLTTLENEVANLNSIVNDNDILVANNTSN